MEKIGSLKIDFYEKVSELQSVVKDFQLKNKFYRKLLAGRGLDFEGYRVYNNNDDSSGIDWKASARANKLLTREYVEEKDSRVVFAIDVSEGMVLGSKEKMKCEYSAEIASSLAYLIASSGGRVGFILFNENTVKYFPPAKGLEQVKLFVDTLSEGKLYKGNSNFDKLFNFVLDYLDKSVSALVLISDFVGFHDSSAKGLGMVSRKFETIGIMVRDKLDSTLPDVSGEIVIQDPSTGEQLVINPKIARKQYEFNAMKQENFVKESFRNNSSDILSLNDEVSFVPKLAEFLKGRVENNKI